MQAPDNWSNEFMFHKCRYLLYTLILSQPNVGKWHSQKILDQSWLYLCFICVSYYYIGEVQRGINITMACISFSVLPISNVNIQIIAMFRGILLAIVNNFIWSLKRDTEPLEYREV